MIRQVPSYEVVCDWPGCGFRTADLGGDLAFWADHGQAEDDWENSDALVEDSRPGREHFCPEHAVMDCRIDAGCDGADVTHRPCCSSHLVSACCACYRKTHFVEVGGRLMTVWHWVILAAAVGTAALWLLLTWHRPRIRASDAEQITVEGIRRCVLMWSERFQPGDVWDPEDMRDLESALLGNVERDPDRRRARPHAEWADEIGDPTRAQIDQALDVIAEPDRRRAEHMNRTMRLAEGGDEL